MTGQAQRILSVASIVVVSLLWGCFGGLTEPDPCYDCYDQITPAKQSQIEFAKRALLGTWRLQAELTGRDNVDRPLALGQVTWIVEIRDAEPVWNDIEDTRYTWHGVLRAEDLCLVDLENFTREGGECTELDPIVLGNCSGRECSFYGERSIEGDYDVATDEFEMDMARGDVYFLDHEIGYINLDIDLALELLLDDSESVLECDRWCSFWLDPAGLYEGDYPDLYSTEWTTSLTWLGEQHRDPLAPVDDEKQTFEIGLQSAVEEVLLGDWNVRVDLEAHWDGDLTIPVGYATYTMNIFEVEDMYRLGEWSFKGGLTGVDLCITPNDAVAAATYECDLFEPVRHGHCSWDGCEDRGEIAIDGVYNNLERTLQIDWASADLFYVDDSLGYVYLDHTFVLDAAPLIDQRVAPTPTHSWSNWWFHTSDAYTQTYAEDWYGEDKIIEIWR